jgi:protein-disulfide isomerase
MANDPGTGEAAGPGFLTGWRGFAVAGALGALVGAGAMALSSGYFVRSYLLEHPEVLPEAIDRLKAKEATQLVSANKEALETPFAGAWAGAKDGDVTLVEFFDYACTFCRRSNADVDRLLKQDPKLKVVWREWPVLGPESEAAARVSLAAAKAGKFRPFHDALYGAGRPTPEALAKAQAAFGVTPLDAEAAKTELRKNYQLANALRATGTPTFVVGNRIFQGAVGYEALKAAVAEARSARVG